MEIERQWLIAGFPAGLPLLKEARVRQGLSLIHISRFRTAAPRQPRYRIR